MKPLYAIKPRRKSFEHFPNALEDLTANLQPKLDSAVESLLNHITAETILLLPPDDPRRRPLMRMNHALANTPFVLEATLGELQVTFANLARAPQAQVDDPWNGAITIRPYDWNSDELRILGRTADRRQVILELRRNPEQFYPLVRAQPEFLIIEGARLRNRTALRIEVTHFIHERRSVDLAAGIRRQFGREELTSAK